MDKERIAQIIRDAGYCPEFHNRVHHSSRARRPETIIVCARASNSTSRSLGTIEVVAQMDEVELCHHLATRFAQPGRVGREAVQLPCVEEEQRIRAIIERLGYLMYTLEYGKGKTMRTYIYAARGSLKRGIGNINTVAPMSEEELRAHIEAKFAQGTAQKGRVNHG